MKIRRKSEFRIQNREKGDQELLLIAFLIGVASESTESAELLIALDFVADEKPFLFFVNS